MAADLQRQRRNADATDHANPLDARDNSGRQRAKQMRAEASRVESQANDALRTAQANYDAALSALKTTTQRPVSVVTTPASGKTTHAPEIPRDESLKQWIDDEAVVPTMIIESDPGFQETIDFLNAKAGPLRQKLWFGQASQKLIIEDYGGVVLIDPKDLSPTVIHSSYSDQSGRHYYVELKTTNSQDKFQFLGKFGRPATAGHRMSIKCEDEFDAKKGRHSVFPSRVDVRRQGRLVLRFDPSKKPFSSPFSCGLLVPPPSGKGTGRPLLFSPSYTYCTHSYVSFIYLPIRRCFRLHDPPIGLRRSANKLTLQPTFGT